MMAIAPPTPAAGTLSYEQYLAEGEINARYDIVDGERIFMPGPSWQHQIIVVNMVKALDRYREAGHDGYVIPAPFDVLIRKQPKLVTRQPDVLFITREQLERGGGIPASGSLEIAPELVVEIISNSETELMVQNKLVDYAAIGVKECWLVQPATQTIQLLRLADVGFVPVALYTAADTLVSAVFPDLHVAVGDLFK
jgi:Uma2 family endonuclease